MMPLMNTRTLPFFGVNSKVNERLIPLIIPEGTSFQTIWMLFPVIPAIIESKLATLLMTVVMVFISSSVVIKTGRGRGL